MADTYGCSARILVNGRKVREYERDEDGAIFIESKINSEYEIELKNHMGTKILAVVSVDGLDVISGKEASSNSPGYILKPYSSTRIKGFRKDDETVGSFRFVNKTKSYAKGQGKGGNEGIISVRFFEQKKELLYGNSWSIDSSQLYNPDSSAGGPPLNTYYTTCNTNNDVGFSSIGEIKCSSNTRSVETWDSSAGFASNSTTPFQTGTTWGTKKYDKVTKRDFDKGNLIGELNFYYTTKDGLKSLGVPVVEEKCVSYPKGFSDYATPPKGWQ